MAPRSIPGGRLRRLAAIAGLMLSAALARPAAADGPSISPVSAAAHRSAYDHGIIAADVAYRLAHAGKVVMLDVRLAGEWGSTGFPKAAMTISIYDGVGPRGFVRAVLKAVNGNRDLPLAVISGHGNRSARGQRLLRNAGFSAVYNVDEGFLGRPGAKGWLGRGLPVEHCVKCQNSVSVKREYFQ